MSLLALFKHDDKPVQYEECSHCEGEGVLEWTKITVINANRSIETPYLFHCKRCGGEGKVEVKELNKN